MFALRIPNGLFTHRWKYPKVLIALMVIELAGSIAALALFGIADPDLFRTQLWQVGYDNGFNSNPNMILYAYANYQPLPKVPFVWSQSLTSFNVAISVLVTFILLVKVVMFTLHVWYPLLSTVTNLIIVVLWVVSMYGQMGPDHADPAHPSNIAWYIRESCSYAAASGNVHYCLMAKATFAVTVFMVAVFLANFVLGIYSMIPSKEARLAEKLGVDDMQADSDRDSHKSWEMKSVPRAKVQQVPYTPRTLAFNTLDRQLPLRSAQYA